MIVSRLIEMRWTVLLTAAISLLLAPVGQTWWRGLLSYYDDAKPVVVMQAQLLTRTDHDAVLRIYGDKLRPCTYLRMQTYWRDSMGELHDAFAQRLDMPNRGDSKPLGSFDIGQWRVWPVQGAKSIVMFSQHDCDGRLVSTKMVEVAL
jgi:hypothetical protein